MTYTVTVITVDQKQVQTVITNKTKLNQTIKKLNESENIAGYRVVKSPS